MNKKVLITGVLGQDGANMVEYLLANTQHDIYGMMRRSANPNFVNITKFRDDLRFTLKIGDLTDEVSISNLVKKIQPDYFVNFAANSFVGCSWDMPIQVMDTNALGVIRCLEAIRKFKPDCRFYSAGSSEEFGDVDYAPQDMNHPLKPRSPYGASKASARHIVKVYRESYDMYAVHGILFNHEGTKRGEEFVTRKITKGVAKIKMHIERGEPFNPIELGNLLAKRDWSDSEDFVEGVWLMLNQDGPKDYVLSSNESHSVAEFVEKAFHYADVKCAWFGGGTKHMVYRSMEANLPVVIVNPDFYRPAEVTALLGDSDPVREDLGWKPKISFDKLVKKMVQWDIELERDVRKPN